MKFQCRLWETYEYIELGEALMQKLSILKPIEELGEVSESSESFQRWVQVKMQKTCNANILLETV